MRLLTRYLVKQNLFLLFAILMAGTSLYLLTDIFERLDNIIEIDVPLGYFALYFLAKLPSIISQILPAVFLLALVAQFNLLERTREMTALLAGGISPVVLVKFVLIYGLIWSCVQFTFSQFLGVQGDGYARNLWEEKLGQRNRRKAIEGLWFTDSGYIIRLETAYPEEGRGHGFRAYKLGSDNLTIEEKVSAKAFTVRKGGWVLEDVTRVVPHEFSTSHYERQEVPIKQNLEAFRLIESNKRLAGLSLWNLSRHIKQLQQAGSNVEMLQTAWHGKLAYAGSLVIMGMLAFVITQLTGNIYKAVVAAILATFIFYTLSTFTSSMGEKGILPPMMAAWFADTVFFAVCIIWFTWRYGIKSRLNAPKRASLGE